MSSIPWIYPNRRTRSRRRRLLRRRNNAVHDRRLPWISRREHAARSCVGADGSRSGAVAFHVPCRCETRVHPVRKRPHESCVTCGVCSLTSEVSEKSGSPAQCRSSPAGKFRTRAATAVGKAGPVTGGPRDGRQPRGAPRAGSGAVLSQPSRATEALLTAPRHSRRPTDGNLDPGSVLRVAEHDRRRAMEPSTAPNRRTPSSPAARSCWGGTACRPGWVPARIDPA